MPRERDLAQTLRYYAGPHLSKSAENFAHAIKGGLEFFSPAGDVKDLVSSAQDTSRNVMAGNPAKALASTLMMGAALGGMAIPGPSASKIGKGAGDLTDALRKAADDLPMDDASRMARAKEMGFDVDTPLFHGTADDVYAFNLDHPNRKDTGWLGTGVYTTTDPKLASDYSSMKAGRDAPNVMPLRAKLKNPYYATSKDKERIMLISHSKGAESGREAADEWTSKLIKAGHDGVVLDYAKEGWGGPREVVVFDPKNIRSRFAKFDPAKKGSADILAGLAPLGLAAPFAGQLFPKGDEEK